MLCSVAACGPPCTRWEVIAVLKKVITWAIVIFIAYYLATNPAGAAGFVKDVLHWLEAAGRGLSKFIGDL
jgi:hypothetical protein